MIARWWRSTSGLVALVALGFAIATLAIGAIAYEVTHEALEKQLDHRIALETATLLSEAHQEKLAGLAAAIQRREAARSTASLDYLLVDRDSHPIAGTMVAQSSIKPGYDEFFGYRRGSKSGTAQALTTSVPGGMLIVAAHRDDLMEIDTILLSLFAGTLTIMLLIGIATAALIGWITRRRLSLIDNTALAIIGGKLDQRVPRDGSGSEFDNLASTFNRMLDRITGLMDNLRQVSSDVAHDLRTPLTRLYNHLDRALANPDPAAQLKGIEAAHGEAAELLEIFAALLRIAEIEGMSDRLPRQPLDLSALLEQMAETYRPDMEASGHQLICNIEPDLKVTGDKRLLSQAIANLLDNCIRHTPPGTNVIIAAEPGHGTVQMSVSDNGPGAPGAEAQHLIQRFTRLERSRSTPGHGLGLALVSAVMTAHDGTLELFVKNGFIIRISLPQLKILH